NGITRLFPDGTVFELPGDNRDLNVNQMLDQNTLLVVRSGLGTASGPLMLVDSRTGERRELFATRVVEARYAVGHLVYVDQAGSLRAVAFDPRSGSVAGAP